MAVIMNNNYRGLGVSCEIPVIIETVETDNILFDNVKYKTYNQCISQTVYVQKEYQTILSYEWVFLFIWLPLILIFSFVIYKIWKLW